MRTQRSWLLLLKRAYTKRIQTRLYQGVIYNNNLCFYAIYTLKHSRRVLGIIVTLYLLPVLYLLLLCVCLAVSNLLINHDSLYILLLTGQLSLSCPLALFRTARSRTHSLWPVRRERGGGLQQFFHLYLYKMNNNSSRSSNNNNNNKRCASEMTHWVCACVCSLASGELPASSVGSLTAEVCM